MTFPKEKSLLVTLYCSAFSLIIIKYFIGIGEAPALDQLQSIAFFIAFFIAGDGLFIFVRSHKKAVTNFFVFLCFHLSLVFLLIYLPYPIMSNIGLSLLGILPLSLLHFLGLFLQVRPKVSMYIFLFICCIGFNIFIIFNIFNEFKYHQQQLALAVLICSTFFVCFLEYHRAKKKNTLFFQRYRNIFIRSIMIALLPFVILWVIPAMGNMTQFTQFSFYTVLLILFLPIGVTYILMKNNALPILPNKKDIIHKILVFGGILILLGIILFLSSYTIENIIIILHLIFIGSICLKIGEQTLLHFKKQLGISSNFSNEKVVLDLQITNSEFQYHLSLLIVYVLKKSTLLSEVHILLSADSDNSIEEYSVIYSEGIFPQNEIEKKIRKKEKKIELLSAQENSYCILPLYCQNESLGWIIFGNNSRKATYTEEQLDQFSQLQPIFSNLIFSVKRQRQVFPNRDAFSHKYENEHAIENINAVLAREKNRFRNVLHDIILQDIFILVQISRKLANPASHQEKNESFNAFNTHCEQLVTKIRTILKEAMPATLYYTDIIQSLALLIDNFNEKSVNDEDPFFTLSYPDDFKISNQENIEFFYRIVKELNDNAYLHAKAKWINNEILITEEAIILTVTDNGIGLNADTILKQKQSDGKLGLVSIIHDVQNMDGSIKIRSGANRKGTEIKIALPRERMT